VVREAANARRTQVVAMRDTARSPEERLPRG